ncbi:hypothetical protein COB52_05480 [Candidatus Kaiserbacteria bacterium]|nr:MAG: hypothetical protein COB52_05480 [Candidatus Kaiserbacteria bacterium]
MVNAAALTTEGFAGEVYTDGNTISASFTLDADAQANEFYTVDTVPEGLSFKTSDGKFYGYPAGTSASVAV